MDAARASKTLIKPIPYCQYNSKVVRPTYSGMNIKKTISNFKFKPNYWETEIKKIVKETLNIKPTIDVFLINKNYN